MARLSDPFYINMVCLSREEAALVLSLLLGALQSSDEELDALGKSIGFVNINVRETIMSLGEVIDDDWDEMVERATELLNKA